MDRLQYLPLHVEGGVDEKSRQSGFPLVVYDEHRLDHPLPTVSLEARRSTGRIGNGRTVSRERAARNPRFGHEARIFISAP